MESVREISCTAKPGVFWHGHSLLWGNESAAMRSNVLAARQSLVRAMKLLLLWSTVTTAHLLLFSETPLLFLPCLCVITVAADFRADITSVEVQGRTDRGLCRFLNSDVILAGQGSGHSGYSCESKLSLWGMLTLNAFTGATLMSAVILQRARK